MKTVIIILIILITIILMRKKIMQFVNKILGWMKPKKDKDPKTPPLEPLPVPPVEPPVIIVPEPPVEEPPVIVEPIPEPVEPEPTPEPPVEEVPEEKNVYHIQLDPNPEVDNTVSFQEQLNTIPDGVMITDYPKTASFVSSVIGDKWMESFFISTRLGNVKYVNIILPKGEYRMEGDEVYRHLQDDGIVTMWHRKHLLFQGESATEKTVLYTTTPATPYGGIVQQNKYSYRRQLWLRYCDDIELFNILLRGPNVIDGRKIGMTEANTPDFWYQSYDKGEHVPFWYLYKHEERLIGDREIPKFDAPIELSGIVRDIFIEKLYTEFLKDGVPEGEMVPAAADGGSISGSSAYRPDWEQEHAVDLRDSTRIRLYNFDVLGPFGDAVYIGGCKDIHIHHCHFKFMGRQGVAICNNVENVLIEHVVTELGRRADYDFEPDLTGYFVRGVEVRYCSMSSAQTKFAANGRGSVDDIYIHDNTFTGSGHFIICYDSLMQTTRNNWRVENNERIGGFGSPIADTRFRLTDNVLMKNNILKISHAQSKKSAEFFNCKGVQLIDNDFGAGEFIVNIDSEIVMEGNTPIQIEL